MKQMTSEDIHQAIRQAMKEVAAESKAGTLDLSGRYYTDEELAEMRATGAYYVAKKAKTAGTAA